VRAALIESDTMNDHGFARLLERLHADAEQAAEEYERLRRGLVKFFDWRGVWPPDECADEVFDRLARKLEDTAVQDVAKYAHGIARLVALERRRRPAFSSIDDIQPLTLVAPAPVDDAHPLQDCFERCLAELPEENRQLLLGYYEGERSAKISNRRRLASTLGVTEAALRSRVQRLRDRLEQCVQSCSSPLASDTL
jgi:DNA-directed RNA polymerase specialized sigma24 family protein